jgi:hypothetical protein
MKASQVVLKGHRYHTLSNDGLRYVIKDASEAAKCAREMGDAKGEGKYLDQINDAVTILGTRYHHEKLAA